MYFNFLKYDSIFNAQMKELFGVSVHGPSVNYYFCLEDSKVGTYKAPGTSLNDESVQLCYGVAPGYQIAGKIPFINDQ